jgi:hypothetical protein
MPDPTATPEAEVLAAIDEGIAAAEPVTDEPAADPVPDAEPVPADPAAEPEAAGEPEPVADEPKAEEPKPDDTETEIAALGAKGKTADRIRGLAAEVKELAPIREALTAAGIKDVADIPRLVQKAQTADALAAQVMDTGATPDQYGQALDYLALTSAAAKGDRAAAEQAYELLTNEVKSLAQMLGKELPGIHDPLAAHPELLEEVEAGDLTRARALQIVAAMAAQTHQSTAQQQSRAQAEQQHAQQQADAALTALGNSLAAQDPHYLARFPALKAAVNDIRNEYPPDQWVARTQRAYERIAMIPVAAPVAAAPVLPKVGPVRAQGHAAPPLQPEFKSAEEALEWGIANAR